MKKVACLSSAGCGKAWVARRRERETWSVNRET
jgi:hypothetical protein